ncbi:cytochrome c biogenesis CcdA family protein [Octadecabacter sp. CECT 8868]|uniref:cytochrome c biogenesis CcdA family protein n=1 Tax=Octadecabacter algicola TaxID=2909342 RepID=UPI001F3BEB1C|nr:cytochrome c biogenesis CcdA family protein [Octadecabacter algicola]MCF2906129.1 cytochrome c biogenesis CcdA family protein [Octadecabacter algicola]
MELIFAYIAGLLTLINPCVLPILPIVLASALQVSRAGPLALCAGLSLSFVLLGVSIAAFGRALGVDTDTVAFVGALLMIAFGVMMLVPRFADKFASATGGMATAADEQLDDLDRSGLRGQFLGGMLLGAVWVPCVGPTLGGAIALASTGESLGWATLIMLFFALGISTIILLLAYGAQAAIRNRRDWLRTTAAKARPAMGVLFILTGLVLAFGLHKYAEIWLLDTLPYWLQDLSVRF